MGHGLATEDRGAGGWCRSEKKALLSSWKFVLALRRRPAAAAASGIVHAAAARHLIRAPARRRQGALGALYDNAPHTRSSILTFRERRRAPPSFVGRLPEAEVPENSPIASSPVVPISKALFPGERFGRHGAFDSTLLAPREFARTIALTHSRYAGPSALDQGVAGAQTP